MVGKLFFQPGELVLRNSLHCGQSFRWVIQEHTGFFYSTLKLDDSYDLVMLRQLDDNCIEYDCYKRANLEKLESHLKDYFKLDVSLNNLMTQWSDADPKGFQNKEHRGVRVLNQNPWETLCSFICSSNNNISRITKMCHSLATEFGDEIAEFDGTKQYSFPSSDQIIERASEEKLRDLGFGYRAKYIIGTAQLMSMEKGDMSDSEYMLSWRTKGKLGYQDVKEKLMAYPGVGPKVADCVLLMGGLGFDEVVPVDVHIARIASRDYKLNNTKQEISELQAEYKKLPITRKKVNYELDMYRRKLQDLWGPYAGWAQCVLFAQEIGKTVGASTSDKLVKRRKLDYNASGEEEDLKFVVKDEADINTEDSLSMVKIEDTMSIEYSITGRPLRRAVKKAKKVY
ncbi:Ogg1 [Kluyveromyces lactis]|nr:Ogg1 [Kluyveromyces lactis]